MSDPAANDNYESVDPRCIVGSKQVDIDLVTFLPTNYETLKNVQAYENPVANREDNSHVYESPACPTRVPAAVGPKHRMRVNDMYEETSSEERFVDAKIFEAIRKLDPDRSVDKKCHFGCFAYFSLILLCLLSLSSSGYIFYRVEIQESTQCSCNRKAETRAYLDAGDNKNKQKANVLLSKKFDQLQKTVLWLKKKINEIMMNNTLTSGLHWTQNMEEIRTSFNDKMHSIAENLTLTRNSLKKANAHLENFEERLTGMNHTLKAKIANFGRDLVNKASFKNCSQEKKVDNTVFQSNNDLALVTVTEKTTEKIVGVTCASTKGGKVQDSRLKVEKEGKNNKYICVCTKRDSDTSNSTIADCALFYWKCPNT